METTNVLVKFEADAQYADVAPIAKQLKIPYVGVKKPNLIAAVNAKIDLINSGQAEQVAAPVVENNTNDTNNENPSNDGVKKPETTGKTNNVQTTTTQKAPRTTTPRVKGEKWYETTAPLYSAGDTVDIIAGPCLVGRQAVITQPSAKKDSMKCKLINPKDGSLQGTEITMDYYKLKLATPATKTTEEPEEKVENENATEVISEDNNNPVEETEEVVAEEVTEEIVNEEPVDEEQSEDNKDGEQTA